MLLKKSVVIIPARGGSKGVPGKNIKLVSGYPLIAYTIAAANLCKNVGRVIISTDSEHIAGIARKFGGDVPFLRPQSLAQDQSPDIEFVIHAIEWMKQNEEEIPDFLINLRTTTPLRDPELIDTAIRRMETSDDATSLRSIHPLSEPPQKMMGIENGYLTGLFPHDPRPEYFNLPRQAFPPAYHPNGYVDIYRVEYVQQMKLLHGPKILGFITPVTIEIDTPEDLEYLNYRLATENHLILEHLEKKYRPE